jgi:3-phosphoshikimate 1-carboxyvinyltransferase
MKARIRYTDKLSGSLDPPSSKNYTTRYLLAAALAQGESVVHFPAISEDAEAMLRGLRACGASISPLDNGRSLRVIGFAGRPRITEVINPGNAGAVARLLMGVGALVPEARFETHHHESLGVRPQGDLLSALAQLGVQSESANGCLPVALRGGPARGGRVWVSGARSSQYLSSLLFVAPLLPAGLEIEVRNGLVSKPVVRTTLEVMRQAGIDVEAAEDLLHFCVPGGQTYRAQEYWVNGDYPSSAAILAAGAVTASALTITRLFEDCQGERAIVPLLREMGADVEYDGQEVRLRGHGGLRGVAFDGDKATDMVLAAMAMAAYAQGETRLYGIGNLRLKECDRIAVPAHELGKIGVDCTEGRGEMSIRGCPEGYEGGIEVDTHHDHRVAQMLAIVGLRCRRGLVLRDAENVAKSYPDFFGDLTSLGAALELEQTP